MAYIHSTTHLKVKNFCCVYSWCFEQSYWFDFMCWTWGRGDCPNVPKWEFWVEGVCISRVRGHPNQPTHQFTHQPTSKSDYSKTNTFIQNKSFSISWSLVPISDLRFDPSQEYHFSQRRSPTLSYLSPKGKFLLLSFKWSNGHISPKGTDINPHTMTNRDTKTRPEELQEAKHAPIFSVPFKPRFVFPADSHTKKEV